MRSFGENVFSPLTTIELCGMTEFSVSIHIPLFKKGRPARRSFLLSGAVRPNHLLLN